MKKITCEERDAILHATGRYDGWQVWSSLTDLSGEFGAPRIETTWAKDGRAVEDVRHPNPKGGDDVTPCEHYEFEVDNG